MYAKKSKTTPPLSQSLLATTITKNNESFNAHKRRY